jgi:putative intracellular protease/amidase
LGSNRVRALKPARVVLAWDQPTRSLSAGWARYVLERRYGQPVTAIRAGTLTRATLSDYDVIVLPSGNYSDVFNEGFGDRLRAWMSQGGTLVTLATATQWAAGAGLLETTNELRGGAPAGGDENGGGDSRANGNGTPEQPIDYLDAIQPDREPPIVISGSILNGVLDTDHWLSSGTDGQIGVLMEGTRIFTPLTLDHGTNVGRYAEGEDLVESGIVWDQSRDQLMNKAFLMHQPMGQGHLIAFAEDPNYRAYTEAEMLLFLNAVLMGPGF